MYHEVNFVAPMLFAFHDSARTRPGNFNTEGASLEMGQCPRECVGTLR